MHRHQPGAAQEQPVGMVESSVGQLIFRPADHDHAGIRFPIRADDRDTCRAKIVDSVAFRQEIAGDSGELPAHVGGRGHRRGDERLLGHGQPHEAQPRSQGGAAGGRGVGQQPEGDLPRDEILQQLPRARNRP